MVLWKRVVPKGTSVSRYDVVNADGLSVLDAVTATDKGKSRRVQSRTDTTNQLRGAGSRQAEGALAVLYPRAGHANQRQDRGKFNLQWLLEEQ